ncbi:hypothetical protein LXA43DRAFT_1070947 [Ganoderma leucocontextum]|nr:hypothetical protein LXA43DRAFT_1070947 [Ganoderma leucocontextum]
MANSSRSRYQHIHPSSPLNILQASSAAGIRSMRAKLNQLKEEERMQQGSCTYCGNFGLARAARYYNQTCQLADFKARHKRECANFAHPPTTSAFLTKPVAGERFPQQPVFAHGHEGGVGCWVSVSGRIDCECVAAHILLVLSEKSFEDRQHQSSSEQGRDIIRRYKAASNSLLSLSVLVQNRRKEKDAILVFAPVEYAAAGVVIDPWAHKTPRLEITYFNGQEVKHKKAFELPPAVKDPKEGIVALNPGEYGKLRLQFRVGDGDRIAKDWEAIGCCETIRIPYAIWDGTAAHTSLALFLPLAHTPDPIPEGRGKSLCVPFDQRAVSAYYADFIEHGEEAYMRSHFGDARADMAQSAESMGAMMGEMLLGQVAQTGGTDVLVQRLRDMGMGDIADKIGARGR